MKHPFLAIAAVFALSGVAHARPPVTDEEWLQYQRSQALFQFQQFGADPETARWAVWAMEHQPSSHCAITARQVRFYIHEGNFPSDDAGQSLVVGHICEPAALKEDALNPPLPQTEQEEETERQQWGVTNADRARVEKALADKRRKDEIERRKNLGTPYYLTSPNNPNFVDPCRFVEVEFPETAQEEGREGEVDATCHFQKGDDGYWRADSCRFSAPKRTGDDLKDAAKRYMTSACWAPEHFHTQLDQSGAGTMPVTFLFEYH